MMMMMMMMHIVSGLWLDKHFYILPYYYLVLLSDLMCFKCCQSLRLFVIDPLLSTSLHVPASFHLLSTSTHFLILLPPLSLHLSLSISLSPCCFDCDAVIRLSILILSCQSSAVHSELLRPPSSLSVSPHPPAFRQQKRWWDEQAPADSGYQSSSYKLPVYKIYLDRTALYRTWWSYIATQVS